MNNKQNLLIFQMIERLLVFVVFFLFALVVYFLLDMTKRFIYSKPPGRKLVKILKKVSNNTNILTFCSGYSWYNCYSIYNWTSHGYNIFHRGMFKNPTGAHAFLGGCCLGPECNLVFLLWHCSYECVHFPPSSFDYRFKVFSYLT